MDVWQNPNTPLRGPSIFITNFDSVWKVPKYWIFPGLYFPIFRLNTEIYTVICVFSPNTGKYRPEKNLYLDTFHAVRVTLYLLIIRLYLPIISVIFSLDGCPVWKVTWDKGQLRTSFCVILSKRNTLLEPSNIKYSPCKLVASDNAVSTMLTMYASEIKMVLLQCLLVKLMRVHLTLSWRRSLS